MNVSADEVDRFRRDVSRLTRPRRDGPLLIAVSGGADSLALLVLARAALGSAVMAATVDHGLRPSSAAEAEHVSRICADLAAPHAILRGPFPARAGRTANTSARARLYRYALLEKHREATGAGWIATAHHADDQVETLMMRLNRGAGVTGLAGIREVQGSIIRPLLAWRREGLLRITKAAGINHIEDPANSDGRYDRARLRKALASADWLDRERIARAAHHLASADEALDWALDEIFERHVTLRPGLAAHVWREMPTELHRRLIRRCIQHIDPAADCGKLTLTRVSLALRKGEQTMAGDVLCAAEWTTDASGKPMITWTFRAAPPRRSG